MRDSLPQRVTTHLWIRGFGDVHGDLSDDARAEHRVVDAHWPLEQGFIRPPLGRDGVADAALRSHLWVRHITRHCHHLAGTMMRSSYPHIRDMVRLSTAPP
jgi:hypothetical protein